MQYLPFLYNLAKKKKTKNPFIDKSFFTILTFYFFYLVTFNLNHNHVILLFIHNIVYVRNPREKETFKALSFLPSLNPSSRVPPHPLLSPPHSPLILRSFLFGVVRPTLPLVGGRS